MAASSTVPLNVVFPLDTESVPTPAAALLGIRTFNWFGETENRPAGSTFPLASFKVAVTPPSVGGAVADGACCVPAARFDPYTAAMVSGATAYVPYAELPTSNALAECTTVCAVGG